MKKKRYKKISNFAFSIHNDDVKPESASSIT